jgi:hypothetical protein
MNEPPPSISRLISNQVVIIAHPRSLHIEILQVGGLDDGAYYPPSEVTIFSASALTNLRDACDEVLKQYKEYNTPNERAIPTAS